MPKDRASKRLKEEQARFITFNRVRAVFPANPVPADPCKPHSISEKSDPELWTAFKFFNLNPRQNPDWWFLAAKMAKVVFPQPGKAGRPKGSSKWGKNGGFLLNLLVSDFAAVKEKHPDWSTLRICAELKKPWGITKGGKRVPSPYAHLAKKTLYGLPTKRPKE
jgi:hypothetical protein